MVVFLLIINASSGAINHVIQEYLEIGKRQKYKICVYIPQCKILPGHLL